ncbi:uncharacterized protein LOC124195584 [Daphnia pulex]|uniref:uncharacterized protein LOC124195584 n=1 Tax=Daphnia pulex TaxID=6669 RepID=UPI001EDDB17B|nr:uncharacterized protein LOC124195584 [Daphnia pulex]XP_046446021.1 uncharacterized protein LOC124195584 [Daphnia pulex]XP_046446022.1 uncharacterized protein LOC124195584 [Daphnia pulex]XP_046446023.1 uncharacterized protein LOC124195584 [Daphnia pulex]XP_046446024.1 uncharacterized protein LOC124195584 [Daphnia pulex]XP_046446025.1 uncharacterized protein LOC124195584 [Daphnia pulex]
MIGMAWENTLLASRILPPAYTPIEVATNRSQDASLMLEQDGRLTLLIILTTSAGLAIVLLFFIFLRIGCLRGQSCLGRYKDRHDRSACPLTTIVLDDHASITKSLAASQQTIQTSLTQTHPPGSDTYAIKLVDNDLIVETQQDSSGCGELATTSSLETSTLKTPSNNPPRETFSPPEHHRHDNEMRQQQHPSSVAADAENDAQPSGFLVFKTWLSGKKSKELGGGETGAAGNDAQHLQQQQPTTTTTPLETKSLCGSPKRRYGRSPANVELIATQKQQIMARFGQHHQHLPGFGFTQSKSSCLFEEEEDDDGLMVMGDVPPSSYSYRNGNQFEYMGGPYGYVDPIYSHQLASNNNNRHPAAREAKSLRHHNNGRINNSVRLEELDIVQQHDQRNSTSLFGQQQMMMSVARQPESATSSHYQPQPVLLLLPTLVRSAESLVVLSK